MPDTTVNDTAPEPDPPLVVNERVAPNVASVDVTTTGACVAFVVLTAVETEERVV